MMRDGMGKKKPRRPLLFRALFEYLDTVSLTTVILIFQGERIQSLLSIQFLMDSAFFTRVWPPYANKKDATFVMIKLQ